MAKVNLNINARSFAELLNNIAVDINGDGKPDAIAICNPDGSPIGSFTGTIEPVNTNIDRNAYSYTQVGNLISVDIDEDDKETPDAIAVVNSNGMVI